MLYQLLSKGTSPSVKIKREGVDLELSHGTASLSPTAEYPPVLVMNPYYSGLGVARSLHGRGMRVYALSSDRNAPGARSRYFDEVYQVPDGRDEPDRLSERLLQIAGGYSQRPVIFPTRDFDVLFLHHYREALTPACVLPQPLHSSILRVMDKFELATVARRLNIPAPGTTICSSPDELERCLGGFQFPLVVKPRFAYQWRQKGVWDRVGAQKAIIVETASELRARYHQVAEVTEQVLLQEYVAGADSDIVVCCCYVGRHGEWLGHFTAKKLKQNPPLVGTGCVVEATEITRVVAPSVELLKAFGYSGLAEIEYKYNAATDTFALIEINPRHWDQHELGNLVGVNLSWIAYRDIVGLPTMRAVPVYAPASRYKWIAERELFEGLVRDVWRKLGVIKGSRVLLREYLSLLNATHRELANLLQGGKVFAVLKLRDPIPGILMCGRLLRESARFACTLLRRKVVRHTSPSNGIH